MDEKQIQVRFINAETGDILFERAMAPSQLPQSFEVQTTFHFDDDPWQVVKAVPATAEAFLQTGKLLVLVKRMKAVHIPVQDILFSLPTICHDLPAPLKGSTKLGKSVYEMHEDDWRQIEFISLAFQKTIEAEFAEIARIYREQRGKSGSGFQTLHVRTHIAEPIRTGLSLRQVQQAFLGTEQMYDGVGFFQYPGVIEDGFAFRLGRMVCYGQRIDDFVRVCGLAFKGSMTGKNHPESMRALERLMEEHDLLLVDWCNMRAIEAQAVGEYLDERADEMGHER